MPEPKLIGFRVDACFDSDAVTDTFALRPAAIQCARLLEQANIEVVGVWEVREYYGFAPGIPDATERLPIDWRAE